MSALEKIRKHSGLLIAVIGIALVAFILGDLFSSGMKGTGGSKNVAVVNGKKLLWEDYYRLSQRNMNIAENNSRMSRNEGLAGWERSIVQIGTLEDMIRNSIMNSEYEAAGLSISPKEMEDMCTGAEPHEYVRYFCQRYMGGYNGENVKLFLKEFNNVPVEIRDEWIVTEQAIKDDRLKTKFENLVKASYMVPTKLAEKYYNDRFAKTTAEIIALPYDLNTAVEVTKENQQKYYEENKYIFKTEATRDIEYVVFPVDPSEEDKAALLAQVGAMKSQFEKAENIPSFVTVNSVAPYDSTWKSRDEVPADIVSAIFDEGAQPGTVFDPYYADFYDVQHNNKHVRCCNIVRLVDLQERADSLRASHILIPYQGATRSVDTITTKEMAEQRADSIYKVLMKSKDEKLFGQLAGKFSSDKSSAEKEGDLDWFVDGAMVYGFNEFVMNNPVGQMGVVESPYGYHVIKVTGKTEMQPKARLAVVRKDLMASQKTYQSEYGKAHKFANDNKTAEKFDAAAEAAGLVKHPQSLIASTCRIGDALPLEDTRSIVHWAFDKKTKVGNVSVFDSPNMFVVAVLTDVTEEGYLPLEKAIKGKEAPIQNLRRGELAVEKMKACGNDYNRMIKELGAVADSVSGLTLESRSVGRYGVEVSVIGTILGMKEGEVVGPIAGGTTAYIIKNVKHEPAPANTDEYKAILTAKRSQFDNAIYKGGDILPGSNSPCGAIYSALHNKAKIKDERLKL